MKLHIMRSPTPLAMLLIAAAASGGALAASASAAPAEPAAAQWRMQKLEFNYSGFTTLYTCDGLEQKVREILLEFGARKDLKVRATGCTEGNNQPSRMAWVNAEFSALVPASDPAAADAVKAAWATVRIAPRRPSYMGEGECELVEQIKPMLVKGFSLRNTQYRTTCTPHQVSLSAYAVTTEALRPVAK
jgi:hypothetical protein